ncbi:unnamed protein product [Pleuronectes platessa]|uniref:Uncharacterized protein n=1 Tax=Pleuronectes platessa TaxID=8262 RepID=A0A9N7Y8X1_PLEPL|nr:unnamed protein product [Pleuronectes platessa]
MVIDNVLSLLVHVGPGHREELRCNSPQLDKVVNLPLPAVESPRDCLSLSAVPHQPDLIRALFLWRQMLWKKQGAVKKEAPEQLVEVEVDRADVEPTRDLHRVQFNEARLRTQNTGESVDGNPLVVQIGVTYFDESQEPLVPKIQSALPLALHSPHAKCEAN